MPNIHFFIAFFFTCFYIKVILGIFMSIEPGILKPFTLRSGIHYRSLSRHVFNDAEKNWICKMLIADNMAQIGLVEMRTTVTPFCARYKVSRDTVLDWIHEFGQDVTKALVDDISLSAIEAFTATRLLCVDPNIIASQEECRNFVTQQIEATQQRKKVY